MNLPISLLPLLLLFLPSPSSSSPPPTHAPPPQCKEGSESFEARSAVPEICHQAKDPEGCTIVVRYLSGGGLKATTASAVIKFHIDACSDVLTRAREEAAAGPPAAACDDAIRRVEAAAAALLKAPVDPDRVIDILAAIPSPAKECAPGDDSALVSRFVDNAVSILNKYWHIAREVPSSAPPSHADAPAVEGALQALCESTSDFVTCMSFVEGEDGKGAATAPAILRVGLKRTIAETLAVVKAIKELKEDKTKGCIDDLKEAAVELDEARDAMNKKSDRARRHVESARNRIQAGRQDCSRVVERVGQGPNKVGESLDYVVSAADVIMELVEMDGI